MLKEKGIVLEPAGALSINALRDCSKKQLEGKNIVCVLSGGNLDFNRLPDIKERYLIYKGLKKYLKVKFPQRPGALKDFVNYLGKFDNIVDFHYSEIIGPFGDARVSIETNKKENFARLFKKLQKVKIEFVEVKRK